jgi:hypothetical protein
MMKRFFARRIVIAIAVFAGVFTYLSLRQFAWAVDTGICVAYTLMVLGDGLTETFLRGHTLSGRKWSVIAITHVCFLAAVLGVARFAHYLKVTDESLTDAQRSGRTYYDFVSLAVAAVLGLAERVLLFRPRDEKVQTKMTV